MRHIKRRTSERSSQVPPLSPSMTNRARASTEVVPATSTSAQNFTELEDAVSTGSEKVKKRSESPFRPKIVSGIRNLFGLRHADKPRKSSAPASSTYSIMPSSPQIPLRSTPTTPTIPPTNTTHSKRYSIDSGTAASDSTTSVPLSVRTETIHIGTPLVVAHAQLPPKSPASSVTRVRVNVQPPPDSPCTSPRTSQDATGWHVTLASFPALGYSISVTEIHFGLITK
uniref:CARMIL C-terminal domain-containing protein n=1 Tax=Panagrellus redivivus TaxID=6233 RepID=A0A7E4V662_PANRE